MNAAKANKNPAKVKGAVLIMILAVMSVLIILLAGSIAVVYSAHNRTELKFRENQAYYTARSLVEEFVDSMMNDTSQKTTYKEVYYQKNEATGLIERKEEILDMAGALEFDLYKVPVSTETDPTKPNYNKWYAEQVNGMSAAEKAEFDASMNFTQSACSDYTLYSDYYKQYFSKNWDSTCNVGEDDTLVYEINTSYLGSYGSDGTNTYGNVFNGDTTTVPPIKVQVLERKFDMGSGSSVGERIRNGDRKKDHIVIKVSAEVNSGTNEMPVTTSLIVGSKYNPPPTTNNAVVSMGSIESQASLHAIGGMSSLFPNWTNLSNNSTTAGNLYYKGSVYLGGTDSHINLKDNEIMFVKDVLKLGNPIKFSSSMKSATIYAGITELACSGQSLGNENLKVNLITQKFQVRPGAQQMKVYGNIFADEFVLTNGSDSNGADLAQAGCEDIINGDVYCNYLAIPDTNVTILYDDVAVPPVAYLQIDNYVRSGTWGSYTYTTSGQASTGWTGNPITEKGDKLLDYCKGNVNIYRGIKIICAGANGMTSNVSTYPTIDIAYGACADANGADPYTYTKVLGHNYNSAISGSEYINFGDTISGPGGKLYKVALDTAQSPANCKQATGFMDLRYERYDPVDNPTGADTTTFTIGGTTKTVSNKLEKDFTRKIELPAKLYDHTNNTTPMGDTEVKFPTERSIFGDYFFDYVGKDFVTGVDGYHSDIDYDGNELKNWTDSVGFHDGSKDHNSPSGGYWGGYTWTKDGAFDLNVTTPPVDFANDSTRTAYIKSRIIPSEIVLGDSFGYSLVQYSKPVTTSISDGSDVNGYVIPSGSTMITGSGILPESHTGIYYIDARSSSIELQIGDGSGSGDCTIRGEFVVVGDQQVTILVPGQKKMSLGKPVGETVNIGWTDHGFTEWTDPIKKSLDIRVQGATPSSPYPNVTYYVAYYINNLNFYRNDTVVCGTIYAPYSYAMFDTSMSSGQTRKTYYGETGNIGSLGDINSYVYGNVICARFKAGQHAGITFIPNDDPPAYGTKKLNFDPYGAAR
ncbi:MAG: hypothetical protein ACI4J0_11410 [Huintestinicola sp.]|uniref:hypothetical protein n=1 Tax=Huintestinicola sp. TaxID=2981661 RepID=UPI003F077E2A